MPQYSILEVWLRPLYIVERTFVSTILMLLCVHDACTVARDEETIKTVRYKRMRIAPQSLSLSLSHHIKSLRAFLGSA